MGVGASTTRGVTSTVLGEDCAGGEEGPGQSGVGYVSGGEKENDGGENALEE